MERKETISLKKYLILAAALFVILSFLSAAVPDIVHAENPPNTNTGGSVTTAEPTPTSTATPTPISRFIEPVYYASYEEDETADEDLNILCIVTCRTLNVRSTPSTGETRIGLLYRNDTVNVLAYEGDWAKIETVDSSDAYVYAAYLEAV